MKWQSFLRKNAILKCTILVWEDPGAIGLGRWCGHSWQDCAGTVLGAVVYSLCAAPVKCVERASLCLLQQSLGGRGGIHRSDFIFAVDSLLIVLLTSAALAVRAWGEWPAGRTEEDVFSALCWEEVPELIRSSGFG